MKLYPIAHKCNKCGENLEGANVISTEHVNCETTKFTLLGGHTVTFEGLRVKIECNPEFNLSEWVPSERFQADYDVEVERVDASVRSGRSRYRVYAKYQPYCQPTETGRIRTAKGYVGIDVVSVRSLYHGAGRVKVGEVTL